jgi:hypothetical protein
MRRAGLGEGGANAREQTKAHRAHAAGGHEVLARVQVQQLHGPHLVLTAID